MPIEEFVTSYGYSEYENFGWKLVNTKTSTHSHSRGPHHYTTKSTSYILHRDTDMPNYKLIKAYEDKYFYLKNQRKYYKKADPSTAFLLFILFVIPGIIYLSIKSSKKKRINEHNNRISKEIDETLEKAKELL